MPEMRYQQIVWFDARSEDGWTSPDDLDVRLASITTVGRVIRETDDVVVIASSEDSRSRQLSAIMYIPKACIAKRNLLPLADATEALEMLSRVIEQTNRTNHGQHICTHDAGGCVICQAEALIRRQLLGKPSN